jgi:hypothetical protein
MKILLISGKKRHGKDTFATGVRTYALALGRRYHKIALADALKDEVSQWLSGWAASCSVPTSVDGVPLPQHIRDSLDFVNASYANANVRWLPDDEKEKFRLLLQWWGTELRRSKSETYWIEKVIENIEEKKAAISKHGVSLAPDFVCVTDCRFPNEVTMLKDHFGDSARSVRITRLNIQQDNDQHPSETALDEFKFDLYIDHATLGDLTYAAYAVVHNEC